MKESKERNYVFVIWDLLYLENEILAHFKIYLDLKES